MPSQDIEEIVQTSGAYVTGGHFLYPVTEGKRIGNHLDSLFLIEPIAANKRFVEAIVEDICLWIKRERIEFDVIFAPNQPAVVAFVERLAERTGARQALWEYLPGGWFGEHLMSGMVQPGDKVLVFNGVSQQGRCVGNRLPGFVTDMGGEPVAAAVFALGTAPGVKEAQQRYKSKLYSTVQVDIEVQSPQDCTICKQPDAPPLVPWTDLRDRVSR